MFCPNCGNEISDKAVVCVKCGVPTKSAPALQVSSKSRVAYILLGLFLGGLGIHNFYAGYTGRAIAQLCISLFTGWLFFPLFAVGLWVLIEICVVSTDAQGAKFS